MWVCNDQCYSSELSVYGKNFNIAIFLDAINIMNVKLYMMVVLIELYPLKQLSVTLVLFQGHSSFQQFENFMFLSRLQLCTIVEYIK